MDYACLIKRYHMKNPYLNSVNVEEARLRAVYAKRVSNAHYSWFNAGHLFMGQEEERQILVLLSRYGCVPLSDKKILEVGCGSGGYLREFLKWGARPENLVGIDLLPDRIAEARHRCPTAVTLHCGSATKLEYSNETFDLVFQSTVFTSVLDTNMKRQIASEMSRVVKREGIIIWHDYHMNNPFNPDVRGVKKREIIQLFPRCDIDLKRISLAPPLARLIAPHSWLGCYLLHRIPWIRTHYLGVIRKNS